MTSWYPLMQVLNTTSPFCATSSGAPNSTPSNVAPDSSARRPRISDIGDTLRVDLHPCRVLIDHTPAGEREQDCAAQRCAEQRRVARPRLQRTLVDSPLSVRVEQRACCRFADAQAWLRNT